MPSRRRGFWMTVAVSAVVVAVGVAATLYAALSYRPTFYREVQSPGAQRLEQAEAFVERTLQLRNDVVNEDEWEAVFTESQINAWLAEQLPRQFSDLVPAGIEQPRIIFEADRLTLAFTYRDGPVPSVIWAVMRVHSSEENEVSLRLEEMRMGLLPVPESWLVDRLQNLRRDGTISLTWEKEDGATVAKVRYAPERGRGRWTAVDEVQVAPGWIRIAGRSERAIEDRRAAGGETSADQRSF